MKPVSVGMGLSAAVHLFAAVGLRAFFAFRSPATVFAELDLSMSTLVPVVPNAGGRGGQRSGEWLTVKKRNTDVPASLQKIIPAEPASEESGGPTGEGSGSGGIDGGVGQYIPASQAARKPKWVQNHIREQDYPITAREQGKDGRVVLEILIDANGVVRDARLLEGAYETLNAVALDRVSKAVFTPAQDSTGRPVACKVILPIQFQLK